MKVLQLLSSLKYDDSERGIYSISHALIKQGHQSVIVATADDDDDLVKKFKNDGAAYYKIPIPKKSWWSLTKIITLYRTLKKEQPDIIHIHARTPAWVLHWTLRLLNKYTSLAPKTIATVYGFYPLNSYAKALFETDRVISASKSIDRYLKKELIDKAQYTHIPPISCIRRGVDARLYPYRYKPCIHWLNQTFIEFNCLMHKKWLVFATELGEEYGQEWLIDIIGNLKDDFPTLHVIIMDNDDDNNANIYHTDFRQRISALNLSQYVAFVGKKPANLKDYLATADIVLALAKQPESIGITVLQALHLGTPVIGWDKGAFADILEEIYPRGKINAGDTKALCAAIKTQLETKVRPPINHNYEISVMIDETIALYTRMLDG